jgi:hypothetical protein
MVNKVLLAGTNMSLKAGVNLCLKARMNLSLLLGHHTEIQRHKNMIFKLCFFFFLESNLPN